MTNNITHKNYKTYICIYFKLFFQQIYYTISMIRKVIYYRRLLSYIDRYQFIFEKTIFNNSIRIVYFSLKMSNRTSVPGLAAICLSFEHWLDSLRYSCNSEITEMSPILERH